MRPRANLGRGVALPGYNTPMSQQIVRGPLLNPRPGGTVDFHADGALAADDRGRLTFVGDWPALAGQLGADAHHIPRAGAS